MVRPCVARENCDLAERSCINVSGLAVERFMAPGHHGYQRAVDLVTGQTSKRGPLGSPGFDRAGKTVLHFVIFSRRPRWEIVIQLKLRHRTFLIFPLFDRRGLSFIPTSWLLVGVGSRARQGWPSLRPRHTLHRLQATPCRDRARCQTQAGWGASDVLVISKSRPLASTAQAMRASLLASAMASTL
jgi:hypothetical protein